MIAHIQTFSGTIPELGQIFYKITETFIVKNIKFGKTIEGKNTLTFYLA